MIPFDNEEEYMPIKTAAEYFYCQRAAFYMITGWENDTESIFLYKGSVQHRVIDNVSVKTRVGEKVQYRYPVVNNSHKLYGFCDAVIRKNKGQIMPLEYKTGKIRENIMHRAQLFFQALCLEEMNELEVSEAFIYFIDSKQRKKILFSNKERNFFLEGVEELRSKLKVGDIRLFRMCGSSFCSYHTVDHPAIYRKQAHVLHR